MLPTLDEDVRVSWPREAWTTVWTNQERSTCTVRLFPLTLRGMAALSADTLAAAGRSARQGERDR